MTAPTKSAGGSTTPGTSVPSAITPSPASRLPLVLAAVAELTAVAVAGVLVLLCGLAQGVVQAVQKTATRYESRHGLRPVCPGVRRQVRAVLTGPSPAPPSGKRCTKGGAW